LHWTDNEIKQEELKKGFKKKKKERKNWKMRMRNKLVYEQGN